MTDVPQIYGTDDPHQGLLGQLIGNADWTYENEFGAGNQGQKYDASGKPTSSGEGVLGKAEANEYGNYAYKEGEITAQEPGAYRANANRANRGGVLHSGVNQGRISQVAQRFANQRYWNTKGHTEAVENFGTARQQGAHGHSADINTKLAEARVTAAAIDQEKKAAAEAAAQAAAAAKASTGLGNAPPTPGEPFPGYRALLSGQVKVKPEPYPGYWARQRGQVKVR